MYSPRRFSARIAAMLAFVLVSAPAVLGAQVRNQALHVIRATPSGVASPVDQITVTFDRPVAGSLDRTVDPATILKIEPAVPGRVEWRDPMSIRFTPTSALRPGTSYMVTVGTNFRAMDGTALAEPYVYTFRARGPTALAGLPVMPSDPMRQNVARHVLLDQRFEVVYSAPVDLAQLSSAAFLEFNAACAGGQRVIRLTATRQYEVPNNADWRIRDAGGYQRNRAADSLRRIVVLTPQSRLPHACDGELVLPTEVTDASLGLSRWPFATYGPFTFATIVCGPSGYCPTGPVRLQFSNPVRGSEVQRHIRIIPDTKFTIGDTLSESMYWTLDARLKPRTGYAFVADSGLRDVFGQKLSGNPALAYRTTGFEPSVSHAFGRILVERNGPRTLAVEHVNLDTLTAVVAPVPDAAIPRLLSRFGRSDDSLWESLVSRSTGVQRIPVRAPADRPMVTGVKLPVSDTSRATLFALKVSGRVGGAAIPPGPATLANVTDLGVHARVGANDAAVWVTGVSDGNAKAGALVILRDATGNELSRARTDTRGLARLPAWSTGTGVDRSEGEVEETWSNFEGYVDVTLGNDRAITAINRWDPDLSPWRFRVSSAYGTDRLPLAGAVFTERGIYRPGETVMAKAVVRDGNLGALRAPPPGDSVKWVFYAREGEALTERTVALSSFGTSAQSVVLPASAPIGQYRVEIKSKRQGKWQQAGNAWYRVAEYRPPEFLVSVSATRTASLPGDTIGATVQARYLFGAPMGRAEFAWAAQQTSVSSYELRIPGVDGWYLGESLPWWEEQEYDATDVFRSGRDTLDARGEKTLAVALPVPPKGRAARVSLYATVTDINRQEVSASTSTVVHPAALYVAVKPVGDDYFWVAGKPQTVSVMAVRPEGDTLAGVQVRATVIRREWHRVRRERDGVTQVVGEWVSDTSTACTITTERRPVPCTFTPAQPGSYSVSFSATDAAGRVATTSFQRWASGPGWVPWSDESQFKMDVIADRPRYSVGDTATILFASPFTNAEAWITVEREGIIQQRRLRITDGSTTLKFPITESFAPNAYVSIVVARGRSAPPSTTDDPGRPTIRVGYAQLRVTPEVKRLTIALAGDKPEYRPGDSARVNVRVRDARGAGVRSEVTLWAVDEGVLSLTGYKTPDLLDLIYDERGVGMRLASNMTSVAPQIPEGVKGQREAGGGGGQDRADILRSRFQTTAFFLGSVVTDAQGNAVASAKLPDNLTTFRLMAVAVTAGDRYGNGESSLLVTRPLLARAALPRFVRPTDQFTAGAVVNRRDGAATEVSVRAASTGVTMRGEPARTVTLAAGRGAEVRFPFTATRGDSATFRFDVSGSGDADAVRVSIPVRPDQFPRAHTVAGTLRDTATIELALPPGLDQARSRVNITLGGSPLATITGMSQSLRVYPYYCTEQVISTAIPLVALYNAQEQAGRPLLRGDPKKDLALAVAMLSRRQRPDGGIGYWSATDWSTTWLSAYAGIVMVDAAALGVPVDSGVLARLADFVTQELSGRSHAAMTPVVGWYDRADARLRDQVAAVDFLSKYRRPHVAAENELFRKAAQLSLEDRARLAEVIVRRGQRAAAQQLMASVWSQVRVDGNRAAIPDSAYMPFYFTSLIRPMARVLTATLAVDPAHAVVGPLVETLALQERARRSEWIWNTQDYAAAIHALAEFDATRRGQSDRGVRVSSGNRVVLAAVPGGGLNDTAVALTGLVSGGRDAQMLRLRLDADPGTSPVYYYVTVTALEAPPPVTPEDRGIRIERWYERYTDGRPITSIEEGELVRVRLRITTPASRNFVIVDDALPAGLEAVDLSLRTASLVAGPGAAQRERADHEENREQQSWWGYGSWDSGWWSPFDHREIRDDRVVYSATVLWPGTYTATYVARATTPGTFVRPPAHAEEMYNPAVRGESDGGTFIVTPRNR